jgi:hypothetical protein
MDSMRAVVYDPPLPSYPHLAVVFDTEGEVLVSKVVPSREEGEAFLGEVMSAIQAQIDAALAA